MGRRDFILGTAALSVVSGLISACGRRPAVAEPPVLRVSTIGNFDALSSSKAGALICMATLFVRPADSVYVHLLITI